MPAMTQIAMGGKGREGHAEPEQAKRDSPEVRLHVVAFFLVQGVPPFPSFPSFSRLIFLVGRPLAAVQRACCRRATMRSKSAGPEGLDGGFRALPGTRCCCPPPKPLPRNHVPEWNRPPPSDARQIGARQDDSARG